MYGWQQMMSTGSQVMMSEHVTSSGVYVEQVWAELLPAGQVEVRVGLSDSSFLLLHKTDEDLAQMMKRLVDSFLDDREMLSSKLLTGLLRVRAADQISDVQVKTVELNKLLQTIINLPTKFSQSEAVLAFFEPSADDQIVRQVQDHSSRRIENPTISHEDRNENQSMLHEDQNINQSIWHEDQNINQSISHEDQNINQSISHEDQNINQSINHEDQKVNQSISREDQKVNQSVNHEDQKVNQSISREDQKVNQSISREDQKVNQSINHEDQKVNQSINHEDQKVNQSISREDQKVNQSISHEDQKVNQSISHEDQKVNQSISREDQKVNQSINREDQKVNQSINREDQKVNQSINREDQELNQSERHGDQKVDQAIRHGDQKVSRSLWHEDQDLSDFQSQALSDIWRSNGFCLANTETILFDLTPSLNSVAQSDESTDHRSVEQTEEAELEACAGSWPGLDHLLHTWTHETDILE